MNRRYIEYSNGQRGKENDIKGIRSEGGQVLPMVLVVLAIGVLIVGPFLHSTSTNSIASRNYSDAILIQYSCEAGVEDAIWDLTYGTLASQMSGPGDSANYTLGESINGYTPSIVVTRGAGNTSIEYEIISTADGERTRADIVIQGGNVSVDSWQIEKE